jgi:hypothetical protein
MITRYKCVNNIQLNLILVILFFLQSFLLAGDDPIYFDTHDHGDPGNKAPIIEPWKTVLLDTAYSGYWVITGDVDGDGNADIVSAENVDKNDVHYTSAVVAQRLDGSVIWNWGNPDIGRKKRHHDVACQIYDWDGDGNNEVILCTKGYLVELDGKTGTEKRRIPINEEASDCLAFANFSGNKRATDVLVKTRYSDIWAYNINGKLLWHVKNPGGYRTAHQARPIDIDNDGIDEVFAGYAMLNADGSVRWIYNTKKVKQEKGHLDCYRILKAGKTPTEFRLVLTLCGAKNIACIDGYGKTIWEIPGFHFESIQTGYIFPEMSEPCLVVDIDHVPRGESPLWVLGNDGKLLGRITADYCRQHGLIDWTGDGYDEILLAHGHGIFNYSGKRIFTLNTDKKPGHSILLGDMTGDGISDITIVTIDPGKVHIFKNENGKKVEKNVPPGCGVNFTYY